MKAHKTCSCGRTFSEEEWLKLPLCGEILTEEDAEHYRLELRHCHCASTIGVETKIERKAKSPL